jgi:hypothetical protein
MKTNIKYSLLVGTMLLFTGLSMSGQPLPYDRPGVEMNRHDNDMPRRLRLLTEYLRYHRDISVREYSNLIKVPQKEGLRDLTQFVSDRNSGIVRTGDGRNFTMVSIDSYRPGFSLGDNRPNSRPRNNHR